MIHGRSEQWPTSNPSAAFAPIPRFRMTYVLIRAVPVVVRPRPRQHLSSSHAIHHRMDGRGTIVVRELVALHSRVTIRLDGPPRFTPCEGIPMKRNDVIRPKWHESEWTIICIKIFIIYPCVAVIAYCGVVFPLLATIKFAGIMGSPSVPSWRSSP
jgi:hypothetical protein